MSISSSKKAFTALESEGKKIRGRLGRAPSSNAIRSLQHDHRSAVRLIDKLAAHYWSQKSDNRRSLTRSYIGALTSVKFVVDDVFMEITEVIENKIRREKRRSTQNLATHKALKKDQNSAILAYRKGVEKWIVVSPLLNPRSHKGNGSFLPKISNKLLYPHLRAARFKPPLGSRNSFGPPGPDERLMTMLDKDFGDIESGKIRKFRTLTTHLFGVLFLIKQLELVDRANIDETNFFGVQYWYSAAKHTLNELADEMFGRIRRRIHKLVETSQYTEANSLIEGYRLFSADIANAHSFRGHDTITMMAFAESVITTGRFEYQFIAIGENQISEMLQTYVGRPGADSIRGGKEVISVSRALAQASSRVGVEITVFGLFDEARSRIRDERDNSFLNIDNAGINAVGFKGAKSNRRVHVSGRLIKANSRTSPFVLSVSRIESNALRYGTSTAFPLLYGQPTGTSVLKLLPRWRKPTANLEAAARRERVLPTYSIGETYVSRDLWIAHLLGIVHVRAALSANERKNLVSEITQLPTRIKIWKAIFRKELSIGKAHAIGKVIEEMRQFRAQYTRHTYYNLRDQGKNYVASDWPTDTMGRQFLDCGVFAVHGAYELFGAVAGSNLKLEFQFVTFLNHLAMVVYFEDQSFMINNDRIYSPKTLPKSPRLKTKADRKLEATYTWAEVGFLTVYEVDYIFFLVSIPQLSIGSAMSDKQFRKGIWQMYLKSQGWGLRAGVNTKIYKHMKQKKLSPGPDTGTAYSNAIVLFDRWSSDLRKLTNAYRKKSGQDKATLLAAMSSLTDRLYDLGEKIADPDNFRNYNKRITNVKVIRAVGFGINPRTVSSTMHELDRFPIYEVVRILKTLNKRGKSLSPIETKLATKKDNRAHAQTLSAKYYPKTP